MLTSPMSSSLNLIVLILLYLIDEGMMYRLVRILMVGVKFTRIILVLSRIVMSCTLMACLKK